jgi:alkanesulfonate monooxygenase SsuD/methylene tetrahydromethanopterin reductase-like flavin-dependent oxidoreductase (luciferase family)
VASVKIGFLLWPQTASWPELRDAAALADRSGAASLWTWDHLNSIVGPWEGPIFEGWTTLAGWSQVTERATLGLMVAANTFRNPGLTAKLATTLDHLSGGRAVLGLGGAWFEREHEGFGIDFGSGFGERLDRLDEAVMLVRRLLDGETVTHDGPVYPMREALCAPPPVQVRLPIMIGGSGKTKTLKTVARYADQWNVMGELTKLTERDAILREHCAAVGRDETAIERSTTVDIVIRDTHEAGLAYYKARLAGNGEEFDPDWNFFVGPPAEVAEGLQPILELGFRHVLVDMPGPYDTETIGRIGELVELLNA